MSLFVARLERRQSLPIQIHLTPAATNSTQPIWFPRAMPGPPELDVAAIAPIARRRVPQHAREDVRIEAELEGNAVTIVERRRPWRQGVGPDWTSSPVARLRYVVRDKSWTLYWRDRNGRWHRYTEATPTADVTVLLNEIDEDPTGIFWG